MHDEAYKQTVRNLSDKLVEAQKPIRILDAIKWKGEIKKAFFAKKCQSNPPVDLAYYQSNPLPFDPAEKKAEFHALERETLKKLGQFSPLGHIVRRMCKEYQLTVDMLRARGTPDFGKISQELYGSSQDIFHAGDPTLADLSHMLNDTLQHIAEQKLEPDPKIYSAEQAASLLQERLQNRFKLPAPIRVLAREGMVSDAAAGADYIKLNQTVCFSERELQQLEVHEGWVHVGTTLNGQRQPYCTFLSKGTPSTTVIQEGLAIFTEIIAFSSYPERVNKISNRIQAIHLAENGADFLTVFRFFQEKGWNAEDSFAQTSRIFRGSTPCGLPFTKDLSYSKGFILIYNFIRLTVKKGRIDTIPLLFTGKITLEDIRTLSHLVEEGLVQPPAILPPQFADLKALVAWMCYSNFLNRLDLNRIESDYANII